MPANFSIQIKEGDESIQIEKDVLIVLILLPKKDQKAGRHVDKAKIEDELNPASLKSQHLIFELLIVCIVITLSIFCYLLWKGQKTFHSDDLFEGNMKEFILNQVVQAR